METKACCLNYCFSAIWWLSVNSNLEVLVFVSMGIAHVSFQLACVEESLCAAQKLASAQIRKEWHKSREEQQSGVMVTHLNCFIPLCASMWRRRCEFLEKRRPQPATVHWHGRCKHLSFQTFSNSRFLTLYAAYFAGYCMIKCFLTSPVCTVSCSLSFHCLVKVAPHSRWEQLNSCSGFPARKSFIFFQRLKSTLTAPCFGRGAAHVCLFYTLLKAFN